MQIVDLQMFVCIFVGIKEKCLMKKTYKLSNCLLLVYQTLNVSIKATWLISL